MKTLKQQRANLESHQLRMRLLKMLVFFFSVTLSQLSAQTLSQVESLSTADALPFRDVASITQDSLGFMWFGTTQGLLKYDGYWFKQYNSNTENPNFISKELLTDHNTIYTGSGHIWYVANNSLFRLNIKTDSIRSYSKLDGLKGGVIELHVDHKKQIWIVSENHWTSSKADTKQYLQKFNETGRFKVIDSVKRGEREFTRLTSDAENNLWWTTINGGTRKYTDKGNILDVLTLDWWNSFANDSFDPANSLIPFDRATISANSEPCNCPNNFGGFLFFDTNNKHFFFPISGGIFRFDPNSKRMECLLNISKGINHAIEDNEGNIWFAGQSVLYKMDSSGTISDFTETIHQVLDFTNISQLFIDSNGLLWISTDNGLLKIQVKPKIFDQLFRSTEKGWGNSMRSIFETAEGNVMAMYEREKKLIVFDSLGNQLNNLELWGDYPKTFNPLFGARFFAMDINKEYVYTVNDYLIRIRLKDGHTTIYPQFSNRLNITGPNPIITLKDGRLLFGFTLSKLTIYNPVTGKSELVFKDRSHHDILHFRFFLESKTPGIIWVGTVNDGLLKVNVNGTVEAQYYLNSNPPLNNNNVMVIHENEDESLWLGTFGGGLTYLNPTKGKVTFYTAKNGLPNNNVVGILPYKESYLLVSTYEGLSFFNTKTKQFKNFYEEDGLTHNEFNFTSFFRDSKGYYYFGGMNGINRFKPEKLMDEELHSNPIRFTSLTRFNSKQNDVLHFDLSYVPLEGITISPYDEYFQVNWTIPSYFKNKSNTYFTKLEGYESSWFFQGTNPYVRYNKLPAGNYVLEVKNAAFSNSEDGNTLMIPIYVKPIFYKTWWFILLSILCALAIIYGLYRLRIKQLLAVEHLRTKISSDLHDDLGSMLSGIAMQSELLEANARIEDKNKLNKIARLSRDAISSMRDLVWSIDNRKERVLDLLERMEELAEELLFPKGINFHMEKNNIALNKKLPIITKQHLFFIYKEAITNILRHSNAKNVWLQFKNHQGNCIVLIKDDGTLKPSKKSTGFGLSNMALRAKKMNATINFNTENGFEIYIKLPFML